MVTTNKSLQLGSKDQKLVQAVCNYADKIYVEGQPALVAAAFDTGKEIIFARSFRATASRCSLCAEANALSLCLDKGISKIQTIVMVKRNESGNLIVSPCGVCRELLLDYFPEILVIIEDNGRQFKLPLPALLPYKYAG